VNSRDRGPDPHQDGDDGLTPAVCSGIAALSPVHGPNVGQNGVRTIMLATISGIATLSPAQSPSLRQNGLDTIIPAAISGTADHPPGALAARTKRLDYSRAYFRNSERLKSDVLEIMKQMPAQRDPVLRPGKLWTGVELDRNINERLDNIESALLQVVGVRAEKPCISCERGHGPWNCCVVLNGNADLTACAGCRFRGNDTRCNYYRLPPPEPIPEQYQQHETGGLQGDVNRLQQRTDLNRINLDEAGQAMEQLQEEAFQGNINLEEAYRTMITLAETLKNLEQELFQAHDNYALFYKRYQELACGVPDNEGIQEEEAQASTPIGSQRGA
jgi:hypothetical protein